jgi:ribosomal protein S15P/S13E
MYYNTHDLKSNLEQNLNQFNENIKSIESDYDKKTEAYFSLKEQIVDVSAEPFSSISYKKSALDQSFDELKERELAIQGHKADFKKLAKGKDQFRSNEKEWKEWSVIKKNLKKTTEDISSLANEYSSRSNKLAEALSDGTFKMIEPDKFNANIQENMTRLSEYALKMKKHIKTHTKDLKKRHENREINDSTYRVKSEIVEEMENQLFTLKSILKRINMTKSSLNLSNAKNNKIWVGTNTKSNNLLQKVEELIRKVENIDKELINLTNKLNEQEE